MKTTHEMLLVAGLGVGCAMSGCGGSVTVDDSDEEVMTIETCASCHGNATVILNGFDWVGADDPGLDVDVCVGVSCGQALVGVVERPEGDYPPACLAQGDEVGCCFSSPSETMPSCSAEPGGAIRITMVLPLGAPSGTTVPVTARVRTMLGDSLADLRGSVRLVSCGEDCVTGEAIFD